MLRIKTKKSNIILLISAVIAVMALSFLGYLFLTPKASIETDKELQAQAERKESEDHKKVLIEKQKNEDTQTTQQTTATDSKSIVITFYEINGSLLKVVSYISDRVEDDGVCKLIVTNKKTNTEVEQLGVLNSNTTSCGLIEADISKYKDDKDAEFYIQYSKNGSTITSERKRLY